MLNEKMEYKEYLNSDRLNKSINEKDISGIRHVLTNLCRGRLDEKNYWTKDNEDRNQIREELLNWLKRVCFDEGEKEIKWGDKIQKKLEDRQEEWCEDGIRGSAFYYNGNTLNFSIILADAIMRGPLKEYYFICKKGFWKNLVFYSDSKPYSYNDIEFLNQLEKKGKMFRDNMNRILKEIASVLLSKEYNKDAEYVRAERNALAGWLNDDAYSKGNHLREISYGNEPLIQKNEVPFMKGWVKIHDVFVKMYDIRIIEADSEEWKLFENRDDRNEYIVFIDDGYGKYLKTKSM